MENIREYGKVYVTKNYEQFKRIDGNRPLNKTKYSKLLESIKEVQLVIPIIVNENMEIVDGQHRFNCCVELNKDVYYIVNEGYKIEGVKRANLVSSNWNTLDYLNLHIIDGNTNYNEFADLLEYSRLNIGDLVKIFAVASNVTLDSMRYTFENGELTLNEIEKVKGFLVALKDFETYKGSTKKSFIAAFVSLYFDNRYDHSKMQNKLKTRINQLEKNTNRTKCGYLSVLTHDIYSFGANPTPLFYDERRNKIYA